MVQSGLMRQPNILVVDDSRSARDMIREFLEQEGYAVSMASDGKEAVKKFREKLFDLVLMDANMPIVDGFRACAEIRRCPNGSDTGIIMITGHNDDESVEKAFAAGAEEYITKPILWSVLRKRIRLSLNNRQAQEQIAEGRARLEAIVNTAADAIIVINQGGCIESINPAVEKMFGYSKNSVLGQNVSMLMPSPHRERHDSYLYSYLQSRKSKIIGNTLELIAVKCNGKTFPIELTVSEVRLKDRILFSGIIRDITERKEAEEKLFYQARYDALTGIANRSLFMETLEHAIESARMKSNQLALIFIDLDRFKWVNDSLGHGAGDELLKISARRIKDLLRGVDTVARLGGDEFTVILPDSNQEQAVLTARRILQCLNESFFLAGTPTYISGSLGVAFFPQDAQDKNGLLKCADEAMYRSKKAGRNSCHVFGGNSFSLKINY